MPAPGAPTLLAPLGPAAPPDTFVFRFPANTPAPTAWDLDLTDDPTFAEITVYRVRNSSAAFSAPRRVDWPYPGVSALGLGRWYWWRARGRSAGVIGEWSRGERFTPEPTAVREPYLDWARAAMAGVSWPRLNTGLGTLVPTGRQVAALLTVPYRGRIRVIERHWPPATDRTVELLGTEFHVDAVAGWDATITSADLGVPIWWRARDTFTRTAARAAVDDTVWGTAEQGGAWSLVSIESGASEYAEVRDGAGVVGAAGPFEVEAQLRDFAVRDAEALMRVRATAGSASRNVTRYRYFFIPPDPSITEPVHEGWYQIVLDRSDAATTALQAVRYRADVNGELVGTLLGSAPLPGIPAGEWWWVRSRITGAGPTRLQARAWRDGTAEPTAWGVDVSDPDDAELGTSGDLRLRGQYLGPGAGEMQWDDLDVNVIEPVAEAI